MVHDSVEDTREMRLAAVALVLPRDAAVCGLTAAWLYAADVRREEDLDVHVAYPQGRRRRPQPELAVPQETQRRADDRRRDAARRLGWHIVVVSADDYYGRFDDVCRDVADAVRARQSTSSATRLAV